MDRITVKNLVPSNVNTIRVQIPPNTTSDYNQGFDRVMNLDPDKAHFISRVTISLDTAGIFNLFSRETVTIITQSIGTGGYYTPNLTYNGVYDLGYGENVIFEPGNWTLDGIMAKINSRQQRVNPADPTSDWIPDSQVINIPRTGGRAFKTELRLYGISNPVIINPGVLIDFTEAPTIQKILGFVGNESDPTRLLPDPQRKTFISNESLYIVAKENPNLIQINPGSNFRITWAFNESTMVHGTGSSQFTATNAFDSTFGRDTMFVGCDLIKQSSTIQQNFIGVLYINVAPGEIATVTQNCTIPVSKLNFSNILWRATTRLDTYYDVASPINVWIEILSQEK